MNSERVYFVGLRYKHHACHSGYDAFCRYVGTTVRSNVSFRWTQGKWGWPLNQAFCRLTRHPWYSIGAHMTEWGALSHMLRRRNCLYHVLYGDSDLWLLRRANRFTGNRLVATFHQPSSHLKALGSIERIARCLDGAILVSEAQRSYFEEFLPPERVWVVPHGVDTNFFHPPEKTGEQPVCVTVGSHLRDFETLRDAMRIVWNSVPEARFIAIGTRSDKKSYFPVLTDDRIRFLDRISDEELLHSLQMSKVAVFSFQEATANNAMLEAMASGLPVVATDVGGIREYIDDENGILCPQKDPQALAVGILRLLDDSTLRDKKAKAGRSKALRIDFRIVAERMSEVYSNIMSSEKQESGHG